MDKINAITKIPEGEYCHGYLPDGGTESVVCPYWKKTGVVVYHRNVQCAEKIAKQHEMWKWKKCEFGQTCKKSCWMTKGSECKDDVVHCTFLGVTDDSQDTLLWDKCKICDVNIDDS